MAKKAASNASKGKIKVTVEGPESYSLSRWPENEEEKADVRKQIEDAKK